MVATQFTQAKQRPNIVLVVADDMEYSSIGAYGCPVKDITPNIDKLGLSCKSPWIGANQLPKDFGYPEHEERDILYTSYLRSEALHLRVQ